MELVGKKQVKKMLRWFSISALALLAACGSIGPRASMILESDEAVVSKSNESEKYGVVGLDIASASEASRLLSRGNQAVFVRDTKAKPVTIGEGDLIEISILTTSDTGFIDLTNSSVTPISSTTLPLQNVGSDGMVSVPPIGRIKAAGNSVQAFERLLSRRLGEVLIEPAVIVRIAERSSAQVSVLGSVTRPGNYSINQNSKHLVDVIANAGGPTEKSSDLEVTLSRNGKVGKAALDKVYAKPRLNVHMRNRDIVSLDRFEKRISVLGAGGRNSYVEFDRPDVTLADALGQSGGLVNRRADKKGIFVFRRISKSDARALGVDTTEIQNDPMPIIFNLDLTKPQALFAAQEFLMSDKDLIYVSDNLNEELSAIFGVLTNFAPTPSEFVRDATISN